MFEKKNSKKVFKKVEISENVFLGFPKAAAVNCFLFVRIIYIAFFPKKYPSKYLNHFPRQHKKKKRLLSRRNVQVSRSIHLVFLEKQLRINHI